MPDLNRTDRLERLTNFSLIVASTAMLLLVVDTYMGRRLSDSVLRWTERATVQGKITESSATWQHSGRQFVLALSVRCGVCRAEAPFYAALVRQAAENEIAVSAMFSESEAEARSFLEEHDLIGVKILPEKTHELGVRATPTILLISGEGKLEGFWRGRQRKTVDDLLRFAVQSGREEGK